MCPEKGINLTQKVEMIKSMEMKELGIRIRFQRFVRDMKQKDLAKMIGTSETYLSAIERGKRLPSINLLLRITCSINISLSMLFGANIEMEDMIENMKKIKNRKETGDG